MQHSVSKSDSRKNFDYFDEKIGIPARKSQIGSIFATFTPLGMRRDPGHHRTEGKELRIERRIIDDDQGDITRTKRYSCNQSPQGLF